jgi:hypothetical protein
MSKPYHMPRPKSEPMSYGVSLAVFGTFMLGIAAVCAIAAFM